MNYKEILIFDISSEYGHFRKYNTTTSPLTYSIPTRTAIGGVLGAILGMEREISDGVYPDGAIPVQEFFSKQNSDIAVQIVNPVKKENVGINLINTKKSFYDLSKAGRTQIEFELLKDLKFRIFLSLNSEHKVFNELVERIKVKNHYFSPYLGLAQFTATIDFVNVVQSEYTENTSQKYIEIITVVNLSKVKSENPIEFNYSANGQPIKTKVENYYKIESYGNILFL